MKASFITLAAIILLVSLAAPAQIILPQLIGDGMILQREQHNRIWGWASAKEEISLKFKGKKYRTTADNGGNWEIKLPPQRCRWSL